MAKAKAAKYGRQRRATEGWCFVGGKGKGVASIYRPVLDNSPFAMEIDGNGTVGGSGKQK
jgi:hypothetical protein